MWVRTQVNSVRRFSTKADALKAVLFMGSTRVSRINDKVVDLVQSKLEARGEFEVEVLHWV